MKIMGNTVGTTLPKPNWDQDNSSKGDFIRNKPDLLQVDTTLKQSGMAADAAEVGKKFKEQSDDLKTQSDTFEAQIKELTTPATAVKVVQTAGSVTITSTVDGNAKVAVITLDENGVPTKVTAGGVECAVSWEGFE